MKYRREIDGLRALAVVPVVLFHAGVSWCQGGYVGVDVFFVISGYLISTIILDDHAKSRFSILTFYERRAKRILPALATVILASVVAGWFLFLPAELRDLGKSVSAVALFASNMLFWGQSGYFAPAAEQMPLLHTWSLAVEEQFYLLFPFILVAIVKRAGQRTLPVLFIAFLASLAAAEWASRAMPGADFYFAPFRAWELLLGAMSALVLRSHPDLPRWRWGDAVAGAGLVGLLASVVVFAATTRNPSLFTLLPTLGTTAIVLFATAETRTGRLLGVRPLVVVGLGSYSLYLWHQPAFAFARAVFAGQAPQSLFLALMAGLVPLTWLSYRFVEVPTRSAQHVARATILRGAVAVSLVLVALGAVLQLGNGFPARLGLTAELEPPKRGDTEKCNDRFLADRVQRGDVCSFGATFKSPSVAIVGDSHAGTLSGVFADFLGKHGDAGVMFAAGWCAPLLDFRATDNISPYCPALTDAAFAHIEKHPEITTVVLVGEWAAYTEGERWGVLPRVFVDSQSATEDRAANPAVFTRALARTVARLHAAGKRVVLVQGVPEHVFDVPSALARARYFPGLVPVHATTTRAEYQVRNTHAEAAFHALKDVTFVRPADVLCADPSRCLIANAAGESLYGDGNHLSDIGAAKLRDVLEAAVYGAPHRP